MNKVIKIYVDELNNALPSYAKDKKRFVADIKRELINYYYENHDIRYDLIVNDFGSPIDLAQDYLLETGNIIAEKRNSTIRRIIAAAILIGVISGVMLTKLSNSGASDTENIPNEEMQATYFESHIYDMWGNEY